MPNEPFEIGTVWNGVELLDSEFRRDLRGWIMWRLCCLAATHCGDPSAALEVLGEEADEILKLKRGKPSQYDLPVERTRE